MPPVAILGPLSSRERAPREIISNHALKLACLCALLLAHFLPPTLPRPTAGCIHPRAPPRRAFAAIASDAQNLRYAAFAPLTAYVWAHHLNATPLVALHTRDGEPTHVERLIAGAVARFGGVVVPIRPRAGDRVPTSLQCSRLAAFQHADLQPSDFVITSDVDLWPLSPAFWRPVLRLDEDALFIFNGPYYDSMRAVGSSDFVALSLLGAPVRHWRRLYEDWWAIASPGAAAGPPPRSMEATLHSILDAGAAAQPGGRAAWDREDCQWNWDQVMAGRWLEASRQCPLRCRINYRVDRLDRIAWAWKEGGANASRISDFTDVHLPHPLTSDAVFLQLRSVWRALFGNTDIIDAFRVELLEAASLDRSRRAQ